MSSSGSVVDTVTLLTASFEGGRTKSHALVDEYKAWLLEAFTAIRAEFFAYVKCFRVFNSQPLVCAL